MQKILLNEQILFDIQSYNYTKETSGPNEKLVTQAWKAVHEGLTRHGRWCGVMPSHIYHLLPGVSSSLLRLFHRRGPYAYWWAKMKRDYAPRPSYFYEGEAVHAILLEKKSYVSDEDIVDKLKNEGKKNPRLVKEYKEWKEAQGR